jgi:hypothetical protein
MAIPRVARPVMVIGRTRLQGDAQAPCPFRLLAIQRQGDGRSAWQDIALVFC